MIIQEDTRQQIRKHDRKHQWFDANGIQIVRSKLLCGDYSLPNKTDVAVDTKQNMGEVYSNLIQDHERFRAEADLAKECGIKLYVLVETYDVKTLDGVRQWRNPRYIQWMKIHSAHKNGAMLWKKIPQKPPANSQTLWKIMKAMAEDHGVNWVFCTPEDAGAMIVKLLTEGSD